MYHKTFLLGRVGKAPESRFTPNGKQVTDLSLAVDDGYGENKKTVWYRVSAWGTLAEIVDKYVVKGMTVFVEGRLRPEINVFDRKDGTHGASYEVTADVVKFIGGGKQSEETGEAFSGEADLPF